MSLKNSSNVAVLWLRGASGPSVLADLAKSALSAEDAKHLRIREAGEAEVRMVLGEGQQPRPAYKIPYFDIKGSQTEFFRLRFLDDGKPKYVQPARTQPGLYLAPFVRWLDIAADPSKKIYITEGEKKAACATKIGFPTIGLGGVWSFKSKKTGQYGHLFDFQKFVWKGRIVTIVFDSDVSQKPQVLAALHAFARELVAMGAIIGTIVLPSNDGEKMGLDDFLVLKGANEFSALPSESFRELQELWKTNEEFALIEDPVAIWDRAKGKLLSDKSFKILVANRKIPRPAMTDDGGTRWVPVSREWLEWPNRATYAGIEYAPGQPERLENGKLNVWKGWGVESVEGNVTPWLKLVDHLFKRESDDAKKYFLQWCAYPVKNPGAKLYTCTVFHGRETGAGKSYMGLLLGMLYGTYETTWNFAEITASDMNGPFNSWAERKQFILCDEASGNENVRVDADRLKAMITRASITINVKYQPQYTVRDCVNYIITSNHVDAGLYIESTDRRYFVVRVEEKMPPSLVEEIKEWVQNGGISALRHHLDNNIDLTGFNPTAEPPMTQSKLDVIDHGRSDGDRWASDLVEDPEYAMGEFCRKGLDMYTLGELYDAAKQRGINSKSSKALAACLARAGIDKLNRMSTRRGREILWVVRNRDKYRGKTNAEIAAMFNESIKDEKIDRKPKF